MIESLTAQNQRIRAPRHGCRFLHFLPFFLYTKHALLISNANCNHDRIILAVSEINSRFIKVKLYQVCPQAFFSAVTRIMAKYETAFSLGSL